MRSVGVLLGLVVTGMVATGTSALIPGAEPTLVTAGAGLLGIGVVGLAVGAIDATGECPGTTGPFERAYGYRLSNADWCILTLSADAVFVRVALVHLVADPFRASGVALTVSTVVTIGVFVGYRIARDLLDALRYGLLACGLGGALCVSLVAYDARTVAAVGAFDVVVAGSGVILPVTFGLFGSLSGAAGWWLADQFARADPVT